MIQISTLSSNTYGPFFFNYSDEILLNLELMNITKNTSERETISTLNKAAECLPELNESPSDACIEAILAFSRKTAKK